jgi:EAL domain-containing protein (putative c-di-GMP-specific phosphodiesterase class I)
MHVVAEGVEDAETLRQLTGMGCDSVQGYYFTPPLPPDELTTWLEHHTALTTTNPAA